MGMTIKQMHRAQYLGAIKDYSRALIDMDTHAIVVASIRIHSLKGRVPRRWHSMASKAYKNPHQFVAVEVSK